MSNPYEIRLEMLKMAQDALNTEYHTKCDMIRNDWNNKTMIASRNDEVIPEPELPPRPRELIKPNLNHSRKSNGNNLSFVFSIAFFKKTL